MPVNIVNKLLFPPYFPLQSPRVFFFLLLEFFSRPLQSERLEQAILAFHLIFLGRARPTQIHPKGPVSRPVIIYRLAGGSLDFQRTKRGITENIRKIQRWGPLKFAWKMKTWWGGSRKSSNVIRGGHFSEVTFKGEIAQISPCLASNCQRLTLTYDNRRSNRKLRKAFLDKGKMVPILHKELGRKVEMLKHKCLA